MPRWEIAVSIHSTGWTEIEADTREEAEAEAQAMASGPGAWMHFDTDYSCATCEVEDVLEILRAPEDV